MARPKSEDRRSAIVSAAIRLIAAHGLDASTAAIAKEAQVSNGSLFTYFDTKADLLNQVYVDLKMEMAAVSLGSPPTDDNPSEQMQQLWSHWMHWAVSSPEKHKTIAHLMVSDDITLESREIGQRSMAGVTKLLERTHKNGPMRNAPMAFVMAFISAVGNVTVDFMIQEPANADEHCKTGFDAMWRMLS